MVEIAAYPASPLSPRLEAILGRRMGPAQQIEETVRGILERVRQGGDRALAAICAEIDKVALPPGGFRVPRAAAHAALASLPAEVRQAMEAAARNVRSFHEHQRPRSWFVEAGDGVILGKKVVPVQRVGICAPAGAAPLFSSLMMAAIPAQVAGVAQICVVSPPRPDGLPHPLMLAAATLLGLDEIYALGGAQAVAALAYGTESIPAVDLVVGPGSPYTVAAQRQVFGRVGVPLLPGPSEIVVVADQDADPRLIAADLLSQAEHGWGVASVCITPCRTLAAAVQLEIERQVLDLPRREQVEAALGQFGVVVVVPELGAGFELLNRIAPEHAELMLAEPWRWLDRVRNCGALFLGPASAEPVGDYYAGTNHILPTDGAARYASSLEVAHFLKTTSIISYSTERLEQTGGHIMSLARAEGLEAHARAIQVRLRDGSEAR